MAFTLTVRFRGMYVYVPDFAAGGTGQLHVLAPASRHEPHTATLAYEGKGSGDLDLSELTVRFIGLRAGSGTTIPDLATLGRFVHRSLFDPAPGDAVAARIQLPAWERVESGCAPTWSFGGSAGVKLTNDFTFAYTAEGENVTLLLSGPGIDPPPITLEPDGPGGTVAVTVEHLPVNRPPCPKKDDEAPHFGMLYALCHDPVPGPSPILAVEGECRCEDPPAEGGSPYTCLAGQAPPGP